MSLRGGYADLAGPFYGSVAAAVCHGLRAQRVRHRSDVSAIFAVTIKDILVGQAMRDEADPARNYAFAMARAECNLFLQSNWRSDQELGSILK